MGTDSATAASSVSAAAELDLPLLYLESTGYIGHVRAVPLDIHAYPIHPSLAAPPLVLVRRWSQCCLRIAVLLTCIAVVLL